jgi:hypothetical protein
MNARNVLLLLVAGGLAVTSGTSCSDGFPIKRSTSQLTVAIESPQARGTRASPLPLSLDVPGTFKVRISALRADGSLDTDFNGAVRLSAKPGAVQSVSGEGTTGRSVALRGGVSALVDVNVAGAFGEMRIIAEDLGYEPVDPLRNPPPACADGKDNDGDGLVDFPADPGCEAANDDTEAGGSYAGGSSDAVWYELPRIADVRGAAQGGTTTAFPKQQLQVATGYDPFLATFRYDVVVTRIASDGFFFTDLDDLVDPNDPNKPRNDGKARRGYSSLYSFNFNPPPGMRVCDRLRSISGTATEFFGMTQIAFPTWTLEEWDERKRPCGVPEPFVIRPEDIPYGSNTDRTVMSRNVAGLVRVRTEGDLQVTVTQKLGAKLVPCKTVDGGGTLCIPETDATNCDINGDGRIDFDAEPEKTCAAACTDDVECSEYSNFASRSTFAFVVADKKKNTRAKMQADGSTSATFRPQDLRGRPIRSFTGTLRYFSGGAQYTIEARCSDDIVIPLDAGIPSMDKACVSPRQLVDLNSGSQ